MRTRPTYMNHTTKGKFFKNFPFVVQWIFQTFLLLIQRKRNGDIVRRTDGLCA